MKWQYYVLIGLFLVLLLDFAFAKCQEKPKIIPKNRLLGNYNAQTIPPFGVFVLSKEIENKALIEHELVHWQQYQKTGALIFYGNYLVQKLFFGYDKMPLEKAARTNESQFCQENYTQCVRNGTAKTVQNEFFR